MPESVAQHPEPATTNQPQSPADGTTPPMPFTAPDGASPPMPSEVKNGRDHQQRPSAPGRWGTWMMSLRKMMHRSPRGAA
ncbi:MAG: hypothetical protein WAK82_44345 [Streptosporangiaceae bacterium]